MPLTAAQSTTLNAAIVADPALSALANTPDNDQVIADAFNAPAAPDFWVWRTSVSEADCTARPSVDGTVWSWPAYIARSQGERDGWGRMFSQGSIDASQDNVRQGIADIFSGSNNSAPAQRTHLLAVARRRATRAEQLFAVGAGSTGSPAKLAFEGTVAYQDISLARTNN